MPATPTLTVVDNADNTGAVATIADSTALSTNTIYGLGVTAGELSQGAFTSLGSRTADGTVNLTLTKGYYWLYCKSSLSGSDAISDLVYLAVTDGEDAVWYQILLAIQAAIIALQLEDVEDTSVIVRKMPLDRWLGSATDAEQNETLKSCPAILICPTKERTDPRTGPTGLNEYLFGAVVASIRVDDQEPTLVSQLPEVLLQRQLTMNQFFDQHLAGVEAVTECFVEPGDILPYAAYKNNYLIDFFTVRCRTWLQRP